MLAEAKLLRQHKGRLEARMQILEDHNRQLEAQLHRLRQLLDEVTLFFENVLKITLVYLSNIVTCMLLFCISFQGQNYGGEGVGGHVSWEMEMKCQNKRWKGCQMINMFVDFSYIYV